MNLLCASPPFKGSSFLKFPPGIFPLSSRVVLLFPGLPYEDWQMKHFWYQEYFNAYRITATATPSVIDPGSLSVLDCHPWLTSDLTFQTHILLCYQHPGCPRVNSKSQNEKKILIYVVLLVCRIWRKIPHQWWLSLRKHIDVCSTAI